MGKHDKGETEFRWEPPKDDFYRARIKTLERENLALHKKVEELRSGLGTYELVVDHLDEIHNGIVNEYQELLEEKDGEIAALKVQINMLKEAVVKGALREVLA